MYPWLIFFAPHDATMGSLRMDKSTQEPCRGFVLEHDGKSLQLDVAQLGDNVVLKQGSMYMVVGEILTLPSGPYLQARVARNVDGMDVELFGSALQLQRRFVNQQ